ncbi:hypothetical protein C0216_31610 (plasmid) [Streptomyces globosus]|uniref:Uncharacterized protein n=1 Tax=Streptomyces globosus TaxID=68209 RepID=A0A344UAY1_9ACTN|nr:hypothetical protein C0216_31610 [Streptomyces globosus]
MPGGSSLLSDGRFVWRADGKLGQQLSHPAAIALRNTAMRLTPSRASTRMILRHHTWTPPRLPEPPARH